MSDQQHITESDAWFVWLPIRQKWVVLASEIEACDFAEKFGGTTVTRDIPPGSGHDLEPGNAE